MKKETLRVLLFALSALFAIVLLDQLVITNLKNSQVVEELEGLPPQKIHCSVLAEEAIKAAIEDYQSKKK